jgi:hypothetical protein
MNAIETPVATVTSIDRNRHADIYVRRSEALHVTGVSVRLFEAGEFVRTDFSFIGDNSPIEKQHEVLTDGGRMASRWINGG